MFLSFLNVPVLCIWSTFDFSTASLNSFLIIFRACSSRSVPVCSDIPWMRIQFHLEYCCSQSSDSVSASNSFDILEVFHCKLFIIFSFSFLLHTGHFFSDKFDSFIELIELPAPYPDVLWYCLNGIGAQKKSQKVRVTFFCIYVT